MILLAALIAPTHPELQMPAAFRGNWIDVGKGCNSGEIGAHLYVTRGKLSDGEFDQLLNRVQIVSPRHVVVWATADTEHPQSHLTYDLRLRADGKMERRWAQGHRSASARFAREIDVRCGPAE